MTQIHCLTCTASLTAPDGTTANELAATKTGYLRELRALMGGYVSGAENG